MGRSLQNARRYVRAMAAGADHAYDLGLRTRQVADTQPAAGADAGVLKLAVVDDCEWFAVDGAEEEDEPAETSRAQRSTSPRVQLPFSSSGHETMSDFMRMAKHSQVAAGALHRSPAVVVLLASGGDVHVDAGPVYGGAVHESAERLVL